MPTVITILLKVAKELEHLAKSSMPKFESGEQLVGEWFSDGIYYRETVIGNKKFIAQFDFRKRESRRFVK